jgi:tungstate transport system ATP-binding protein
MNADDLPIEISGVSVRVRDVALLHELSLRILAGPPTVIVGPNGSGKTTLLRLAMGSISPTRGQVRWGNAAVSAPIRRSFVFQRPVMLRRRVDQNIQFALEAAGVASADRAEKVQSLLARVGLEGFAHRPARRLSGGEQQKTAIARALAKDPSVLFLDEPTASLDPGATHAIEQLILDTSARGVKIVMATHDLNEARRLAGNIVLLHRGEVVEDTQTSAFFSMPYTDVARRFIAGELLV